jgi:tetratricopeptide (TPR) repeat protein
MRRPPPSARALELAPEDNKTKATLNFYLGYLAEKKGSLRALNQAITYYTRAIALDSELYIAYYNRGTVQINRYALLPLDEQLLLETLDAAIADFSTVIVHRPNYWDAYLNRGVAYYERDTAGDMSAALRDLSYVIALKADYVHAYFLRGLAHIRAKTERQWVDDFQQVLALEPDHVGAISGLCWGYVLIEEAETALPFCDQAITLDQTGASRDSRAIAYAQLGRYTDAMADFRAYLDALQQQQSETLYRRMRGPQVEQWLLQLEQNENPFDPTLLEQLRHRDHYDLNEASDES